MAEFFALEHESIDIFAQQLDQLTNTGDYTVISSNAFEKKGVTHYYALLEKFGDKDFRGKILDKLDSIDGRLWNIESNTAD